MAAVLSDEKSINPTTRETCISASSFTRDVSENSSAKSLPFNSQAKEISGLPEFPVATMHKHRNSVRKMVFFM
jgi:hypothetical protein